MVGRCEVESWCLVTTGWLKRPTISNSLCGRDISPLKLDAALRNDVAYSLPAYLPAYFLAQTLTMLEIFGDLSLSPSLSYLEIPGKAEQRWQTINKQMMRKALFAMGGLHPRQRSSDESRGRQAEGLALSGEETS